MVEDHIDIIPLIHQECSTCQETILGGSVLYNWVLSHTDKLYCITCLSKKENTDINALTDTLQEYIKNRPCFKKAWDALESFNR